MNPNTAYNPGSLVGGILQPAAPKSGTPLFDLLERLSAKGGNQLVARFVHSPLATLLVTATPNPVDDMILAALQQVIPKPA